MTKAKDTSGQRLRNSKICQERYIKVHETCYEYRLKEQSPQAGGRSVPWITTRGRWLEQAGFEVDTPIKVRVMGGVFGINYPVTSKASDNFS